MFDTISTIYMITTSKVIVSIYLSALHVLIFDNVVDWPKVVVICFLVVLQHRAQSAGDKNTSSGGSRSPRSMRVPSFRTYLSKL